MDDITQSHYSGQTVLLRIAICILAFDHGCGFNSAAYTWLLNATLGMRMHQALQLSMPLEDTHDITWMLNPAESCFPIAAPSGTHSSAISPDICFELNWRQFIM